MQMKQSNFIVNHLFKSAFEPRKNRRNVKNLLFLNNHSFYHLFTIPYKLPPSFVHREINEAFKVCIDLIDY